MQMVEKQGVQTLNKHIDLCLKLFAGEVSEEEFNQERELYITEEADYEMQRDTHY